MTPCPFLELRAVTLQEDAFTIVCPSSHPLIRWLRFILGGRLTRLPTTHLVYANLFAYKPNLYIAERPFVPTLYSPLDLESLKTVYHTKTKIQFHVQAVVMYQTACLINRLDVIF